jgi:[ribosomal protein S5]-alanine N-acetyltransferase
LPEFQRKGYISEALTAILNYGFETIKLNCIDAFVDKDNIKSIKILERFGFIKMHVGDELLYSLQKK